MLSLLKEKHDVERKEEAAFKHMNLILFAKHGGGYVMAWGSFSASGLECLLLLKISMNFQLNQQILEEKKNNQRKVHQQKNGGRNKDLNGKVKILSLIQ